MSSADKEIMNITNHCQGRPTPSIHQKAMMHFPSISEHRSESAENFPNFTFWWPFI